VHACVCEHVAGARSQDAFPLQPPPDRWPCHHPCPPCPHLAYSKMQAQNVAHLPWALIGTAGISCLIYFMLALSLVLLTYPSISAPGFPQFPCATYSWVQSSPTIGFTSAFVYAHCEYAPLLCSCSKCSVTPPAVA
jgi:hypothetical protein